MSEEQKVKYINIVSNLTTTIFMTKMLHHVQKLCKGCVAQHNQNKTFSFINIVRLAVKYGGLFLIILIIADQNSYDQFRANKDRIYRIQTVGKNRMKCTWLLLHCHLQICLKETTAMGHLLRW